MSNNSSVFNQYGLPGKNGLYDPSKETENCGVGFVAHIKGQPSHQIVLDADHILRRMEHRGACGCETNTGDGAGIMTSLPHTFLSRVAKEAFGTDLPAKGRYAAGNVFLPVDTTERETCKKLINEQIAAAGQKLIGWRLLPVSPEKADIGPTARQAMPHMEQLFVGAAQGISGDEFERKLYVARKNSTHAIRSNTRLKQASMFYYCSLSPRVIVYKGMLNPDQMLPFYPDLAAEDYTAHLAMVHSRFSTNTFPSWDRAQPCRFMSHNGEINTRLGNANWMSA
ncbi:MAG TPA: glutamate synthase subunit alpha, partial [Gammaproteobacteria bacterium]|nr:glutamate synthase subunit alpha [Gammaproteobacteria bacterium]